VIDVRGAEKLTHEDKKLVRAPYREGSSAWSDESRSRTYYIVWRNRHAS
jgi:hypothetical protein